MVDLKERLVEGDISSYSWLLTDNMLADVLTKEMHLSQECHGDATDSCQPSQSCRYRA